MLLRLAASQRKKAPRVKSLFADLLSMITLKVVLLVAIEDNSSSQIIALIEQKAILYRCPGKTDLCLN